MEKNTEIISSFFRKVKPSLFKIKKHPVRKSTSYEKQIYVTMLYTIAGVDSEIDEAKKNFVKRIARGIRLEGDSSKYINKATNIDEKTLSEFLNFFSGSKLAHNFFVDSMVLLSCSDSVSDKAIEGLSEYAEVLKIEAKELESLTSFSEIIINKNEENYYKWLEGKSEKLKLKNFLYYIKEFTRGRIINEEDYEYWYGKFDINESLLIERKKIKIKNADISLSKDTKLEFKSCDKIDIDDSDFRGHFGIHIENSRKVEIEESKFTGFKSRALYMKNIVKLEIEESEFIDCSYSSVDSNSCGGAIYLDNIEKLYIEESLFKDCSSNGNTEKCVCGGAISINNEATDMKIKFKENMFVNCNCHTNDGEAYKSGGTINGSIFKATKEQVLKKNRFQRCNQEIGS